MKLKPKIEIKIKLNLKRNVQIVRLKLYYTCRDQRFPVFVIKLNEGGQF